MCRTIDDKGREKSACVGCQSPCLDIDAERTYWANLNNPDQQLLFYGYFGLMLGFFCYYYLYAGNWDYYYSGIWSHDPTQLTSLFSPGFFICDRAIPIPKIIAAPLTLGIFTLASYWGCKGLEKFIQKIRKQWSEQQVRHICYIFAVFVSFNVFFIFAGRPNISLLPKAKEVELLFNSCLIAVSTIWFRRNLRRNKSLYQRESLTGNLRRQLQKLKLNWAELLEGRSLEQLDNNEVYVLAKVLPGLNRQSQLQVYRGVLQEALSEGKTKSADSLELLQDLRQQLQISPAEHYDILHNLEIENPSLLDPTLQHSRENELRLEGYRDRLESLLVDSTAATQVSIAPRRHRVGQALQSKQSQIDRLRLEYNITPAEQEQSLLALSHPNSILVNISATLLEQLQLWNMRYEALTQLLTDPQFSVGEAIAFGVSLPEARANAPLPPTSVYQLLRSICIDRTGTLVAQLFNLLELLADDPVAPAIARTTGILARQTVNELLGTNKPQLNDKIHQILLGYRCQASPETPNSPTPLDIDGDRFGGDYLTEIVNKISQINQIGSRSIPQLSLLTSLQDLLQELDPLTKAASLYALSQIVPDSSIEQIVHKLDGANDPLVQATIDSVLKRPMLAKSALTFTIDLEFPGHQSRQVYQPSNAQAQSPVVVKVGRALDNDLVILDKRVSRYHALFKIDANGIVVRDVSSYGLRFQQQHLRDEESILNNDTKIYLSPSDDLFINVYLSMTDRSDQTITTLEKLLWLRYSRLFDSLNERDLKAIARNSSLRIYKRGDILCRSGEPAASILLQIAGNAQSVGKVASPFLRNAARMEHRRNVSTGQIIGGIGILANMTYSETVVAESPEVSVLVIKASSYGS
jgi:hypothetical protein